MFGFCKSDYISWKLSTASQLACCKTRKYQDTVYQIYSSSLIRCTLNLYVYIHMQCNHNCDWVCENWAYLHKLHMFMYVYFIKIVVVVILASLNCYFMIIMKDSINISILNFRKGCISWSQCMISNFCDLYITPYEFLNTSWKFHVDSITKYKVTSA